MRTVQRSTQKNELPYINVYHLSASARVQNDDIKSTHMQPANLF